jgi:hypothetical protein
MAELEALHLRGQSKLLFCNAIASPLSHPRHTGPTPAGFSPQTPDCVGARAALQWRRQQPKERQHRMPSPRPAWPRCFAAAVVLGVTAHGGAATAAAPRAAALQALSQCRKLTDSTQRLACFDKAAAVLDQAEAQGQVVVVDRDQVRTVRRQAFGFNIPTLSFFGRGGREEEVDNVMVELTGASSSWQGKWTFVTKDDAVWQQTDTNPLFADPHRGSRMQIKKGVLGSFFCKVDNQPAVRCVRSR